MSIRSKFIVVGSSGYIGKYLMERGMTEHDVLGTSSSDRSNAILLDLTEPSNFDYGIIFQGDTLLITAAVSSPDICAKKYDYAWSINVTGTSKLISEAIARGGRVILFSSDTVYGERLEPFDERADCSPSGEYAAMKHEVENRFRDDANFKSIRLSYVFSKEDKFTQYLHACTERGEEADLFHPFNRTIVHRDDVVVAALALAERWDEFPQKIINFGGPEVLSRIEFAECLQRTVWPSLRYRVTEPDDAFFENRPRTIAMLSPVLPRLLERQPHTLQDAAKIEFGKE